MVLALQQQLSEPLRIKILEAKDLIFSHNDRAAVSVSGGKDSLVVMDIALNCGVHNFVYCDTTMDFPGISEYLDELEFVYAIKIDRVKAPCDFFNLVKETGFPSRRMRWCCDVFKFAPLTNYVLKNNIKYLITGLRRSESQKRSNYEPIGKNPIIPVIQVNPILEFSTDEIWAYIEGNNLYNRKLFVNSKYYLGFQRLGCWPCPFKTKNEWISLERLFPNLISELKTTLNAIVEKFGGVGVKNKLDYINSFGWVKNALPQRNIFVGQVKCIEESDSDLFSYKISIKNLKDFENIIANIDLIKSNSIKFEINKNTMKISFLSRINLNQIKILLEKNLNCVGCGACQSLCPFTAIIIKENKWSIDISKCSNCFSCLKTSKMRGACIGRNYKPFRKLLKIDNQDEIETISTIFSPCGQQDIAIIRTRKDLIEIKNQIMLFLGTKYNEIPQVLEIPSFKIKNQKFRGSISINTKEFSINLNKSTGYSEVNIKANGSGDISHFLDETIRALKKFD